MDPIYDFSGQVAFVTGAASGMGLATAQAFATFGAAVAPVDAKGAALADADAALKAVGPPNAGIQSDATELADVSLADYDRILGINLRGVYACMKYQLLHMRERGAGAIV